MVERRTIGAMALPAHLSDTLHEEVLRRIAAAGGIRHYPAHAVLINEGEQTDTLFIILSGRVKVYASSAAGKEVILAIRGVGDYVGELAIDGGVRSASVMTLEPSTCSVVSGADLRQFIAMHPDFALHLIHQLIRRLRQSADSVKSLALESVYGRIVKLLEDLAEPFGDVHVIPERLTQQDVAERVGSSREMVSRIFKDLQTGGYIDITNGRITILKRPPPAW
jgi:CRP/FNR family cyclic AMP-dependent transcriptional regulator